VTVDSNDTRPTTDRIKETLFNMLNPYIPDCVFVDLFSGSGAIAIEALSRGAAKAYLVEMGARQLSCIEKNLAFTHLADRAQVIKSDAASSIDILERQNVRADIIFMDPPYNQEHERRVLARLAHSKVADDETTIIVESDLDTEFSYLEEYGFEVYKIKKYKTNKHTFIQRR
jgi:16S rRNA (guanine966-N2)-methyltransferase